MKMDKKVSMAFKLNEIMDSAVGVNKHQGLSFEGCEYDRNKG